MSRNSTIVIGVIALIALYYYMKTPPPPPMTLPGGTIAGQDESGFNFNYGNGPAGGIIPLKRVPAPIVGVPGEQLAVSIKRQSESRHNQQGANTSFAGPTPTINPQLVKPR